MTVNPNTPSADLSDDAITAALRATGMIEPERTTEFHRIKVKGATFYADDDLLGVTDIKKGTPAFVAQIVEPPLEYQAKWFDDALAAAVGRPHIANKMCKSHYDVPTEAREHAADGTECRTCPVNPFTKREDLPPEAGGSKCQWRGDLQLRILRPADNEIGWEFDRDGTVYWLSLSFTGMVEFKGMSREPVKGHVSDAHFMHKLSRLGASMTPDAPGEGVMRAIDALRKGLVIAEVRSLPTSSNDGSRHYDVTSLTPIKILEAVDAPALPGPNAAEPATADTVDDIPF